MYFDSTTIKEIVTAANCCRIAQQSKRWSKNHYNITVIIEEKIQFNLLSHTMNHKKSFCLFIETEFQYTFCSPSIFVHATHSLFILKMEFHHISS